MKNIVIITPVYNDWESFTKLINEINKVISGFKDISFSLIAINDGSKEKAPSLSLPSHLKIIEILNMRINQGHAICIANGIKYALKNYQFDNLILMDADGEDRPEEITDLINIYITQDSCSNIKLSDWWIDAGTPERIFELENKLS